MGKNKLTQKAGKNSNQYQIENYNEGISVKEVHEIIAEVRSIISEENKLLLDKMKLAAVEKVQERLDKYTEILIPRLVKAEVLTAFSEPHVRMLYKDSEETAICSDRQTDYEMLSELLIHRINRSEDYTISAAIGKAIKEVNNISEQALTTLTLLFAITTYTPKTGCIKDGLKVLNDLYGHILDHLELPCNRDWIDNLEVVNALRITTVGNSKNLEDYLYENCEGYSLKGIEKDSDEEKGVISKLIDAGLPTDILVEHELDSRYVRLRLFSKKSINDLILTSYIDDNKVNIDLNDSQKQVLTDIYDICNKKHEEMKTKFIELLNEYENIKTIVEWWDSNITKFSFQITAIGRVLACTNAVRIDSSLPNVILK